MDSYITDIAVELEGADDKNLLSQKFKRIDVNLNKGGKATYLWFKKDSHAEAITRIQLTFNDEMSVGLIKAGYIMIDPKPDQEVNIWYSRNSSDNHTPIVQLDVTSTLQEEVLKFQQGWEKLACDLNRRAGKPPLYMWVKREKPTYITKIIVTDSFKSDKEHFENGYIRVDEDARRGVGRGYTFIWYLQTNNECNEFKLSDLKISTTEDDFRKYQKSGYHPVNLNFHEWIGSHPMYLWYKKLGSDKSTQPIKAISLIFNNTAALAYEKAGIPVIKEDLNAGTKGHVEYLCFNQ